MASRSLKALGLVTVTALLLIILDGSKTAGSPAASTEQPTVKEASVQQETVTLTLADATEHEAPSVQASVKPKRRNATLLRAVDQADIQPHHRVLANNLLQSIDEGCRNTLVNFYVRYDNPESRGLGGGSTIIVTGNVEDDEFRALVIHECGHVIDTGAWQGNAASGKSAFVDGTTPVYNDDPSLGFYSISWKNTKEHVNGSAPSDFVSGYASSDPFEDFAETFAYFTLQRSAFEQRAKTNDVMRKKLDFMKDHVSNATIATGLSTWSGTVPWDITKLPYTWLGAPLQVAGR